MMTHIQLDATCAENGDEQRLPVARHICELAGLLDTSALGILCCTERWKQRATERWENEGGEILAGLPLARVGP